MFPSGVLLNCCEEDEVSSGYPAGNTCQRGRCTWGKTGVRSRDYTLEGFWKVCCVGERWQMTSLHPPCAFLFFSHLPFVHSEETWMVPWLLFSFWAAYKPCCVSKVGLVCCDYLSTWLCLLAFHEWQLTYCQRPDESLWKKMIKWFTVVYKVICNTQSWGFPSSFWICQKYFPRFSILLLQRKGSTEMWM